MKKTLKNYSNTKKARIFTALVLSGMLSVGSSLSAIKSASAAPSNYFAQTASEVLKQNIKTNSLPRAVASAILQDLSEREQISSRKL